jgi:hypothetical protein
MTQRRLRGRIVALGWKKLLDPAGALAAALRAGAAQGKVMGC